METRSFRAKPRESLSIGKGFPLSITNTSLQSPLASSHRSSQSKKENRDYYAPTKDCFAKVKMEDAPVPISRREIISVRQAPSLRPGFLSSVQQPTFNERAPTTLPSRFKQEENSPFAMMGTDSPGAAHSISQVSLSAPQRSKPKQKQAPIEVSHYPSVSSSARTSGARSGRKSSSVNNKTPTPPHPSPVSANGRPPPATAGKSSKKSDYYTPSTTVNKGLTMKGDRMQLPNDDILLRYQAKDLMLLLEEEMARFTGVTSATPALKGKIINYEMGLGKTHLATSVVIQSRYERSVMARNTLGMYVPKPELVVGPVAVIPQWVYHVKALSAGSLSVHTYHGVGIKEGFRGADVTVTSYAQLRSQYTKYTKYWTAKAERHIKEGLPPPDPENPMNEDLRTLSKEAPLFTIRFHRVIYDEVHELRNPETKGAQAALTLKTDNVLLLSGTPAQNGLKDLHVLIALLDDKLNNLHKRRVFNRTVTAKLKRGDVINLTKATWLVAEGMEQRMITRKAISPSGENVLELPARHNLIIERVLNKKETILYDFMTAAVSCIFTQLLRQRQCCLHPQLLLKALQGDPEDPNEGKDQCEDDEEDSEEKFNSHNGFKTQPKKTPALPLDDPSTSLVNNLPQELQKIEDIFDSKYMSTKLGAVFDALKHIQKRGGEEKTIIFSSFVGLLDVLGECFEKRGIEYATYTGDMSMEDRELSLEDIRIDPKCKILLVSIKAGGVGLNITACNNVIIFEPWWNPYVEEQAISRVYRKGQTREVYVYRIFALDTVEDRIRQIEHRKETEIERLMEHCHRETYKMDAEREAVGRQRNGLQLGRRSL